MTSRPNATASDEPSGAHSRSPHHPRDRASAMTDPSRRSNATDPSFEPVASTEPFGLHRARTASAAWGVHDPKADPRRRMHRSRPSGRAERPDRRPTRPAAVRPSNVMSMSSMCSSSRARVTASTRRQRSLMRGTHGNARPAHRDRGHAPMNTIRLRRSSPARHGRSARPSNSMCTPLEDVPLVAPGDVEDPLHPEDVGAALLEEPSEPLVETLDVHASVHLDPDGVHVHVVTTVMGSLDELTTALRDVREVEAAHRRGPSRDRPRSSSCAASRRSS